MNFHERDFPPNEERLARIRATIEEGTVTEDFDMKDLVKSSIQTYWDNRKKAILGEQRSIELATAKLARDCADELGSGYREFVSNFICGLLPLFVVLLIELATWSFFLNQLVGKSFPRVIITGAVIWAMFTLILLFLLKAKYRAYGKKWFFRNIAGALLGSIIASAVIGYWMIDESKGRLDITTEFLKETTEKHALTLLEARYFEGKFQLATFKEGPINLSTEYLSPKQAVYAVRADRLPGEFRVKLTEDSGVLVWLLSKKAKKIVGKEDPVQARFFLGTVKEIVEKGGLLLEEILLSNNEGEVRLHIQHGYPRAKLSVGEIVVAAYNPNTFEVTELIRSYAGKANR